MNGAVPTANIMALGVRRPRAQDEMEDDEQMLPPDMMQDPSATVVPGMMPGQMGDPMMPGRGQYDMPEDEQMRVAGRIFTPGQGWKPGPRNT